MTTLTIKIDSEVLAREVLAHLGYLPADGDLPDLVSVQAEPVPVPEPEKPKTHVEDIADRLKFGFPKSGRSETSYKYDGKFCTEKEEPKEGVEPLDNEIGTPIDVYSDQTNKEYEELREQFNEAIKFLPSAEERLGAQIEPLEGGELLDHLDALADSDDPAMRKAVKAYILKEYAGRNLKSWPLLQKILEGNA